MCVLWETPPPTDSKSNTTNPQHPLSCPLSHYAKTPPFEKQMGNWPVLPWQAFLPFPKKKQGGNRFREMRLGMSKRKNEVVFTLIQEGNPKILSLFLIIPTCGWKGTLFVTDVLHST
jgi:hypothetical protein